MHSARKSKKVGSWQAIGALVAHYRRQARLTQERFAEVASDESVRFLTGLLGES